MAAKENVTSHQYGNQKIYYRRGDIINYYLNSMSEFLIILLVENRIKKNGMLTAVSQPLMDNG